MNSILFITHETSRTGAPLSLLYFIEWMISQNPNIIIKVVSLKKEALHNEFAKKTDLIELDAFKKRNLFDKIQQKIISKKYNQKDIAKKRLFKILEKHHFDIVYANTILSIPIAVELKEKKIANKMVAHIHELQAMIAWLCPNFNKLSKSVDHFIAASNLVADNLKNNFNIDGNKVTRVYECSKVNKLPSTILTSKNKFIVGASGMVHWRKGPDLFIQVASILKKKGNLNNFQFVWVGYISNFDKIVIKEDLKKLNLLDKVNFVGSTTNPEDFYKDFDVFLMTSREDPFPLVCIEVGMLGKPIICFKGATGTEEILINSGGTIVPYLDAEAMANAILDYIENPSLMAKHGDLNRKSFAQFTPNLISPQLFNCLKKVNLD